MTIHPILSTLRRNKAAAMLVGLQSAITFAILCNAVFIIHEQWVLSQRPTGIDESDIVAIRGHWVGHPGDLSARLQTDLAALRRLPGVEAAYPTNAQPLRSSSWGDSVKVRPEQRAYSAGIGIYMVDEYALQTLGLKLVAGRNFLPSEISDFDDVIGWPAPASIIITRALAAELFPGGDALGRSIYVALGTRKALIIGIIDRLQEPWAPGTDERLENSVLEPFHYTASDPIYMVRAKPGQLSSVLIAAQKKLFEISPDRSLDSQAMTDVRSQAYRDRRGFAIVLGVVCMISLAVTAFGIVGLTSYWVTQRHRHIGIRRALGATRFAIVRYFQIENVLIMAAAAIVGVGLTIGLNLWIVNRFAMPRLDYGYIVAGAVSVLLLGQISSLWPALRAASVPAASAMRETWRRQ